MVAVREDAFHTEKKEENTVAINRKLGKTTDIRLAMLKTQLTDLILHGKIQTTEARAKEMFDLYGL